MTTRARTKRLHRARVDGAVLASAYAVHEASAVRNAIVARQLDDEVLSPLDEARLAHARDVLDFYDMKRMGDFAKLVAAHERLAKSLTALVDALVPSPRPSDTSPPHASVFAHGGGR